VDWRAFIASLVHSLAWPAAVVVIVLVLRRPLAAALQRGVRRLKAGPIEVEFDEELAEVKQDLAQAPELRGTPTPPLPGQGLDEELARLVDVSPRAAVMEAFVRIEARLGELVDAAGIEQGKARGGTALARLAHQHGLISSESLRAVEGLSVMRNLAAHSPKDDDIDTGRAREYVAMADAVLFSLPDQLQR
jgi:hypothetical protein